MRYFVGVASKNHIEVGYEGGFAQLCHGKAAPLKRMRQGDRIVYYSPKLRLDSKEPYQKFTALGTIADENVYQVEMFRGFFPFRRNVLWDTIARECPLSVARTHCEWKEYAPKLRFGHFEVSRGFFAFLEGVMMGDSFESKICQSCGMPLSSEEQMGAEKDGSVNVDYCKYCYENGEFIDKVSMQEYIQMCSLYGAQAGMSNEQMRQHCARLFPTLKRWRGV